MLLIMKVRKDIPMIHLTYSQEAADRNTQSLPHLDLIKNQREDIREAILQAPKYRLDHLASYVEYHGDRINHILESLLAYKRAKRKFEFKYLLYGLVFAALAGSGAWVWASSESFTLTSMIPDQYSTLVTGGIAAASIFVLWYVLGHSFAARSFHGNRIADLDALTPLATQGRQDTWNSVRDTVASYLKSCSGKFSTSQVRKEWRGLRSSLKKSSKDIRKALSSVPTAKAS